MRLPPSNIQILLPVWGTRYTRDFLDLCLPSLLAPGNIPALSKLAQCSLVLLVPVRMPRSSDEPFVGLAAALLRGSHRAHRWAGQRVEFHRPDARLCAFRSGRQDIRRSISASFPWSPIMCFRDGSLLRVVERVFAGASAVLAGNFVIERRLRLGYCSKTRIAKGCWPSARGLWSNSRSGLCIRPRWRRSSMSAVGAIRAPTGCSGASTITAWLAVSFSCI